MFGQQSKRVTPPVIWAATAFVFMLLLFRRYGAGDTWKPSSASLVHYRLGANDLINSASAFIQSNIASFTSNTTTLPDTQEEAPEGSEAANNDDLVQQQQNDGGSEQQVKKDDDNGGGAQAAGPSIPAEQPQETLLPKEDKPVVAEKPTTDSSSSSSKDTPTTTTTPTPTPTTPSTGGIKLSRATQLPADESQWPCAQSGYCSFGKTKPFFGELDSTQGLRTALQDTSYKKDLFLITIGDSAHALGSNVVASMWKLGLNNVLLFADSQASCQKLHDYKLSNISCGWSTAEWWPRQLTPAHNIWVRRYLIQARAVHMGYNVYNLDTDAWMYDDPYKYLKSPPFADIDIISMQDGYYGGSVNGGANYFQVKDHNGPAGWVAAAIVDRMIRLCENWDVIREKTHAEDYYLHNAVDDQFVWRDIILTTQANRPAATSTWFNLYTQQDRENLEQEYKWHENTATFEYPEAWLPRASRRQEKVQILNLRKLKLDVDNWKPEVPLFPFPPRKNASIFFLNRLKEESGYEHDDGESRESKNDRNETAKWIFGPPFLIGLWSGRGMTGFWDLDPPAQVIAHLVGIGLMAPGGDQKVYILKAHNAFDYDVVAMVTGKLFPTSTPEQPLPKVLALAPKLTVKAASQRAYRKYVLHMIHFAKLTNRVLLVPQLQCQDVPWTEGRPADELQSLLGIQHTVFNGHVVNFYGNGDDEVCTWGRLFDTGCMPIERGGYMIPHDYRELLRRLPDECSTSTAANTVLFKKERDAKTTTTAFMEIKDMRNVPAAEVLDAVKKLEDQYVVYIGEPVMFDGVNEIDPAVVTKLEEFKKECDWARTEDIPDVDVEVPNHDGRKRRKKRREMREKEEGSSAVERERCSFGEERDEAILFGG